MALFYLGNFYSSANEPLQLQVPGAGTFDLKALSIQVINYTCASPAMTFEKCLSW